MSTKSYDRTMNYFVRSARKCAMSGLKIKGIVYAREVQVGDFIRYTRSQLMTVEKIETFKRKGRVMYKFIGKEAKMNLFEVSVTHWRMDNVRIIALEEMVEV